MGRHPTPWWLGQDAMVGWYGASGRLIRAGRRASLCWASNCWLSWRKEREASVEQEHPGPPTVGKGEWEASVEEGHCPGPAGRQDLRT